VVDTRAFVTHVVGRALLRNAAELLASHSIPIMPLKGIWLQLAVYEDPAARPITDVDVLVPDHAYQRACTVLREAGWQRLGANVSESAWRSPTWPLPLDLHRRLFSRGAFRLPEHELFERGRHDCSTYDAPLVLPHPLDVFAHLVGHFVKSRGGPDSRPESLRDFGVMGGRCALAATATAAHLARSGLARAARYVLPLAAAHDPGGFCRAVLAALPADPLGSLCARGMLLARAHVRSDSPLAVLPGFVLERSLPHAARTLALRAWDRRRDQRG
jgi:Uncharacterised nucleotidyltransferase